MRNGFDKNAAVFSIVLLFFMVTFVPAINSSTVKSNILYSDTITYDVYFGTTSPPPKVASNQSETTYDPGTLEYNTTYYWQIVAWNELGESAEGPIWSFTTETIGPSVETLNADPVGKHNATLHGKILEDGGEQCQIRFRYKESGETNWTYPSDWHGSYTSNDTFSEEIDELNLTTLYEFQAGAKNSIDEKWGETKNFTTAANQQPVAVIDAPSTGDKKVDITFDGSNSYDPDGYITEYMWDFSDGTVEFGTIISHSYQSSGVYTVTLKVTDNDGDYDIATHDITINNNAPTAYFVADQYYVEPGETVTFDGTGSYDPDGDSLTYEWKLGDGTVIGTDPIISYIFVTSGDFQVILTVTDDDPANPLSDSVSAVIHVNAPPVADFTMDPEPPIYVGTTVEFDGSISYDPDGYIMNWTWYFEDTGENAYGEVVSHYFYMDGEWTVTLTVTDDLGATDDHSELVIVWGALDNYEGNERIQISTNQIDTDSNSEFLIIKETLKGGPPKTPGDPYPEDGATDVPVDVVLSWTGGEDNPPDPPIIDGPTSGKVGVEYQYNFSLSDPDDDPMYLRVDWGNGTPGPWTGPYDSDTTVRLNHTWNEKGTFTIRAQAKDIYDVESEWSTLTVTMPKNKMASSSLLLRLLEHLSQSFHFFSFIFGYND